MDKLTKNKMNLNSFAAGELEDQSQAFHNIMEVLREVDDNVREITFSDDKGGTLKSLIKVARSNFNRREYVNACIYLGRFHDKFADIKTEFDKIQKDLSGANNEFLFGDLEPEQLEFLMKRMPEKFKKKEKKKEKKEKTAFMEDLLIKEGGVGDWWHNVTTDRGKALKGWEKRFPQYAKQLRRDTEKMISRSEVIFSNLIAALKPLASYRNKSQLEDYIKLSDVLMKKYDQYDTYFNTFYNDHISKLVKTREEMDAKKLEEGAASEVESEIESEKSPSLRADPPEGPDAESAPPPSFVHKNDVEKELKFDDSPITEIGMDAPPISDGPGKPQSFRTVAPREVDPNINPEIAGTMADLEEAMGVNPAADSANSPFKHQAPLSNSVDVDVPFTRALQRTPATQNVPGTHRINPVTQRSPGTHRMEPATHRGPSAPHTLIPSTHVTPSAGNHRTTPAPNTLNLANPHLPKHDPLPMDLTKWLPPPDTLPEESGPATTRSRVATEEFIEELSSLSEESPIILANKIIKFANSIAKTDKDSSDKLLLIAKNILVNI